MATTTAPIILDSTGQEIADALTDVADAINAGAATAAMLAYVENGSTATQPYAKGAYICWKSLLYTSDTAINSGDAFNSTGVNKNLTAVGGGGFNSLATLREWKFVKFVEYDYTNVTSEISGHGYTEVLLILVDKATESTDKIQNGTAVYPISYIDGGYECRVYLTYGTDIYFGSILKNSNGQYTARVRAANSKMRIYAR